MRYLVLFALLVGCGDNIHPAMPDAPASGSGSGSGSDTGCGDTSSDPLHCGDCTTQCLAGQACLGGTCQSTCPSGTEFCNGTCVDVMNDRDNCGSCDFQCPATQACSNGQCGCQADLQACGNTYVIDRDATTDSMLAATSQGLRAAARVHASSDIELRATAVALDRVFDDAGRRDVQVRVDAAAFYAVSKSVSAVIGSTLMRNASNTADFDYTKWTVFAGLVLGVSP